LIALALYFSHAAEHGTSHAAVEHDAPEAPDEHGH
jgi:hypothetical protein